MNLGPQTREVDDMPSWVERASTDDRGLRMRVLLAMRDPRRNETRSPPAGLDPALVAVLEEYEHGMPDTT